MVINHASNNFRCINCQVFLNINESPFLMCQKCSEVSYINNFTNQFSNNSKDFLYNYEKVLFLLLLGFIAFITILFILSPLETPFYLDRLS